MEPEIQAQFGRIHDVTRNMFLDKITAYFQTPSVVQRLKEIPTIEKYEINQHSPDNFITAENIVMYFPDLFERLPLIAVSSVGGAQRPMSLGFPTQYQHNHYWVLPSTDPGPFTLVEGDDLQLQIGDKVYEILFLQHAFADWENISLDELTAYIEQILSFIKVQDLTSSWGIYDFYARDLYVVGGTAATKLGFTPGQGPDLTKSFEFLSLAEDLEVLVDVMTSDRNQRLEVMDIISSLLGMYVYDEDLGQWCFPLIANNPSGGQIIFSGAYSRRGESEVVPENAPYSKVYMDSVSIPVTTILYLQRTTVNGSVIAITGGDDAH